MRKINLLGIHCSATPNGKPVSLEVIRQEHLRRGFPGGIGYHYIITPDGKRNATRPEAMPGCHIKGLNSNSIGICLIGGLGGPDKLNPGLYTVAQWEELAKLVKDIQTRYPGVKTVGHRDTSPDLDGDGIVESHEWVKLCPCFSVEEWINGGMLPLKGHIFN